MKKLKLFIGIVIGIIIFSCSSDENNSAELNQSNDKIVGEWILVRSVDFDGQNIFELSINDCNSKSQQIFDSNGNYRFTNFHKEASNSECINRFFSTSGSWNIKDGIYSLAYEFDCAIGIDCSDDTIPSVLIVNDSLKLRYSGSSDYLENYYIKK